MSTKTRFEEEAKGNSEMAYYKHTCILQVRNYKLVGDDGIIRPEVFYKALTTWANEDFLGYQFSQVCDESNVF